MRYDFDTPVNRRGTASLKWDVGKNELPMWVADMDFKTAPEIIEAIINRARHGVFGYNIIPDEWYEVYISWWRNRHGFEIDKSWLIFSTGVVPSISSAVRKLTSPAERVALITPCYNILFNSVVNNGRFPAECPLRCDGGSYSIDFGLLEQTLSDPQTSMLLLCNPQNPTGRIWSRAELREIGELCEKYSVVVISDEIHCDITAPGREYVPFASVSDVCRRLSVTCVSPTKAFGIPGLQTSAAIVPNDHLRHKFTRGLNTDECAEPNSFAAAAAVAAFTKGGEWLDEAREYIEGNKRLAAELLKNEPRGVRLVKSEATYLLWLDCRTAAKSSRELAEHIRRTTGLYLCEGAQYGRGGEGFLRMNVGCPRKNVSEGIEKFKKAVDNYTKIV